MRRRLLQFLRWTSVKGVSRIFRTKSSFLRTVWVISVVSFLTTAFYLTYILTRDYLEYTSVISLREYNIDLTGTTSDAVRLPDITFCNLNPFAVSTHNLTNIPSLEAYHKRAMDMTSCEDCSVEQQKALRELRVELLTTSGYYVHIGASKAKTISHTQDQFIVTCMVGLVSGMHARKVPCDSVATVKPYYDYMYYNCYTLKLPPGTPENMYSGMVIVLQLSNHEDIVEQQEYLTPHYIPGQMSGAMMIFHQQNRLPVVVRDAINLPSGHFMSAKLRFLHRKRLPDPYGTCQHKDSLESRYQQIICYSTCVQTLVLKSCGCVDYTSYNDFFGLIASVGIPPCLTLKAGKQRLHDNWECVKRIRLNSTSHCLSSCPIPCEELTYSYDMTYSPWPTSPYHDNFYEEYISGRPYESHYSFLRNKRINSTTPEEKQADKEVISQNFLGVQLYVDQQLMMEYTARPQLSLPSFLSQLGGTLNLWAGITVVIVIEILELGYRVLADCRKSSPNTEKSEVTKDIETLANRQRREWV